MSKPQNSKFLPNWAIGLLIAEFVALAIAFVTPLTPNKTGRPSNPAQLFVTDPSYIDNVLVSFLMVNLLLLILGLVVWITTRRGRSE